MSETGKQVKHEVKGAAEKVAGAVAGRDDLRQKGEEELEEAADMQQSWESSRAGTTKDTDGRGVLE